MSKEESKNRVLQGYLDGRKAEVVERSYLRPSYVKIGEIVTLIGLPHTGVDGSTHICVMSKNGQLSPVPVQFLKVFQ